MSWFYRQAVLSAAGPTIYDGLTAAIALIGVGVAAYGLRRQIKREKRLVKVECAYSFAVGQIAAFAPERMVTLTVRNEGHRPVEVTSVGFELPDGRQPLIMPLALEGSLALPRTLNDGAAATFYFDLAQLRQAQDETGQRIKQAFADASGTRYRGKFLTQ